MSRVGVGQRCRHGSSIGQGQLRGEERIVLPGGAQDHRNKGCSGGVILVPEFLDAIQPLPQGNVIRHAQTGISMEVEMLQHQAGETLRDGCRQLVAGEIQCHEAGKVTQLWRNGPCQLISGEIQPPEAGEVAQLRRNGFRQFVVVEIQWRYSLVRLARSPSSGGMDPVSWLPLRYNAKSLEEWTPSVGCR